MKFWKFAMTCAAGTALFGSLLGGAGAETLKIGVIAPLTGPGAPWGVAAAEGQRILANEVNARGGLDVGGKKYQVEVIAYDDQFKAAEAVAAFNRLVNVDGVKYLTIATSAGTLAVKNTIESEKIVTLTSSLSDKIYENDTKFIFRLFSPPPAFLDSFLTWMKENRKERRVAILNSNDETGWAQAKFSTDAYKKHAFPILISDMFERSTKDFQPILTKIKDLKPEIIDLGTASPGTAGLIVRQARELGYTGIFVQTGPGGPKEIVDAAGKQAAEGVINTLYADNDNPSYKQLVAKYKAKVGQEPNSIIVAYYDAAAVLLNAISKAGDVGNTSKVAAAFSAALPMKSLQGDQLTFRVSGGTNQQINTINYVSMIKDGNPVIAAKISPTP
ncbi:MAG: hypothetical protein RL300_223 [Pseudomonadota bacterium]|jgi:branched-chain amino acid transport system substrate-binding protein